MNTTIAAEAEYPELQGLTSWMRAVAVDVAAICGQLGLPTRGQSNAETIRRWADEVDRALRTAPAGGRLGWSHWEARIKSLMEQLSMPDSISLYGAMGQLVREVDAGVAGLPGQPEQPFHLAATPSGGRASEDALYFIQDTRTYVGNCPMWWGPNRRGYTSRIDKAGRYTFAEALAQHRSRPNDLPWLCTDIEPLQRPTIDVQDMPAFEAQRLRFAAPITGEAA